VFWKGQIKVERYEITYKGYRLTATQQPGGGFSVETVPVAGRKPVQTTTFADPLDALASARLIIDRGVLDPR
jgi:hypothetical protein